MLYMKRIDESLYARIRIIKSWEDDLRSDGCPVTPLEVREYIRMRWPDMKPCDRETLIREVMDTVGY